MKDYFPMQLYCTRCKGQVDLGHDCTGHVVWITEEVQPIVDMMSELGFKILKAECYTSPPPQPGKPAEYTIYIVIAYYEQYHILSTILMPPGWTYYTHTVTSDHTPVSVLIFTEQGHCPNIRTVKKRINAIVDKFMTTVDKDGLSAVMTLMQS